MFAGVYLPPSPEANRTPESSRRLLHLAQEHSPRVEVHGEHLVAIDLDGLEALWGTPREIGVRLRRVASGRGVHVRVAVAGTRVAALLGTQTDRDLIVMEPGTERRALASLPLDVLLSLSRAQASGPTAPIRRARRGGAGPPMAQAPMASSLAVPVVLLLPVVRRWGLKTLGELAALPAQELSTRLGAAGLDLQRMARGEDHRPLVPDPGEERFEHAVTLDWPVEGLEPLSFVLGRVLEPLCVQLQEGGMAAGGLHVRLALVTRELHQRTLRFPTALTDAKVLRSLVLADLESHPPPAGIDRVTVEADAVPARQQQWSLLERAVPSPERLSTLLARLSVLMGEGRCGAPAVVDSHEPGAFEMQTFHPAPQTPLPPRSIAPDQALRPVCRRYRRPVVARVTVERGVPVHLATGALRAGEGRILSHAGPWRTSGHWWQSAPWDRDEWDVAVHDGTVYRLFRDRTSKRWFVEGIVD